MARGKAVAIDLSATERGELDALLRRHGTTQAVALRARIVLLAAEGLTNTAIADRLGIDKHTAGKWRHRFARDRLDGLHDEPRPGAPRQIGDDAIAETIRRTLEKCAPPWAPARSAWPSGTGIGRRAFLPTTNEIRAR